MIAPRPSRGLVCLLLMLLAVHVGCQSNTNSPAVTSSEEPAAFHDAAAETGLLFQHDNGMTGARYTPEMVGAGSALFDYDRDGDLDIVLTNNAGPTRLLINDVGQDQHWLGLRLVDGPADARRDVLGAIVRVERPDAPILQRRSATDGSYLSSSDPRTLFGLGRYSQVTRVVVKWPDGREEVWRDLAVDQYHDLACGTGITEDSASSGPSRGRN